MGAQKEVSPPLRVVLDTNVAVSALVFAAGRLSWLRSAWQSGRVMPLASRDTAAELLRVLAYPKFKLSVEEQEELLADYLPWVETVQVPDRLPRLPVCRDPLDVPFLALARAGHADALVTGDGDLLALAPRFDIPIMAPAALRAEFAARQLRT